MDAWVAALRDRVHQVDPQCVVADGDMSDVVSRRVLYVGAAEAEFSELDSLSGDAATEVWAVGWGLTVQWDTRSFSDARGHAQRVLGAVCEAVSDVGAVGQVLEAVPTFERYAPALPADNSGAVVMFVGAVRLTVVI
jgi:hypothetical protein